MEKDDGYSSGDSEPGMRSSVILNSINIGTGEDPNAYKKDKVCTVCTKAFSMLGAMKKHFCKFCFRGVCDGCSKHTAPDHSKGSNVRICDSCYQKAIQDQVRDSLQKDLDKEKNEIIEIQKKLNFEIEQRKNESFRRNFLETKLSEIRTENTRKEKELTMQSEKLNKEIKVMEEDIEELSKILANAESEKLKKDEKISALKQEIVVMRADSQLDIDKITELKRLISEQEKENEGLTKELNAHTDFPSELEDPLCRASLLDDLKHKSSQAKDQHKELKKENDGLKRKLASLREENASKKAEIAKLEESNGRKRSMSKISMDIKQLEDSLGYQEEEIQRLQLKLKNSTSTPK